MEDKYRKTFIKLTSLNDSLLLLAQVPSHLLRDASQWDTFNSLMDDLTKESEDTYYLSLKATPNLYAGKPAMVTSSLSSKVYLAAFIFTQHPRRLLG